MPVIRVEKTKNYTVMANYHLQDKRLSLKAKGLMSYMLSLPKEWDYSIKGLTACVKEGQSTIMSILKELKECGYLVMIRNNPTKENNGRFTWDYIIYEAPQFPKIQSIEKQPIELQCIENHMINKGTKEINTNKQSTKFIKPNLDEVIEYFISKKSNKEEAEKYFDYYESKGWLVGKTSMKDWKASARNWIRNQKEWGKKNNVPDFTNPWNQETEPHVNIKLEDLPF